MKLALAFVMIAAVAGSVRAQDDDDVDHVPPGHPMGKPGTYCGTAHPSPASASLGAAALTSSVIYVNRCTGGCTYTGALAHDAVNDKVAIRGTSNGMAYNFPEFKNFAGQSGAAADAEYNSLVDCIRKVYSYYNTTVVTTRPTSGTYHMMNIAGTGMNLGMTDPPEGGVLLGISDIQCTGAIDNMTSFTFSESHKLGSISKDAADYVKNLCKTATHEAGHSYGLEHEFMYFDQTSACTDPMSYDTGACNPPYEFFRNKLARCGGFEEMPCACTSGMQNSHVRLFGLFGAGTPGIAPPTANITTPAAGGMTGGSIIASIGSERGIDHVDVFINNFKWGTLPGAPFAVGAGQQNPAVYNFPIPGGLPDSNLDIYMRAYDDLDLFVDTPVVSAIKGAPCASADTCAEGQKCEDGKCFWDPPVGEVGDSCSYNEFCLTGMCQGSEGSEICTKECIIEASDSCPEGLECRQTTAGTKICYLPDGGGCCSASDQRVPWISGLTTFVLGFLLLRRRRSVR